MFFLMANSILMVVDHDLSTARNVAKQTSVPLMISNVSVSKTYMLFIHPLNVN